jgi:hypothetical protein
VLTAFAVESWYRISVTYAEKIVKAHGINQERKAESAQPSVSVLAVE